MPSETAAGYIKQPFVHRSIRPAVLFVVVMLMAIEFSPVRLRQHTGSSSWRRTLSHTSRRRFGRYL
jgi:hypothetical protein